MQAGELTGPEQAEKQFDLAYHISCWRMATLSYPYQQAVIAHGKMNTPPPVTPNKLATIKREVPLFIFKDITTTSLPTTQSMSTQTATIHNSRWCSSWRTSSCPTPVLPPRCQHHNIRLCYFKIWMLLLLLVLMLILVMVLLLILLLLMLTLYACWQPCSLVSDHTALRAGWDMWPLKMCAYKNRHLLGRKEDIDLRKQLQPC